MESTTTTYNNLPQSQSISDFPSSESTTLEMHFSEPSSHDLTAPPQWSTPDVSAIQSCGRTSATMSSAAEREETARNELVAAVEGIVENELDETLSSSCQHNTEGISFEMLVSIVDSVGQTSEQQLIQAGASFVAEQVADVLEAEAAGAASSREEIIEAISEVVTENIMHPQNLIESLGGCAAAATVNQQQQQEMAETPLLEEQLTELENLISNSANPTTTSIVVNESKTVSTLERNSCGNIVPTHLVGTVTTTSTTIEPVGQADDQQQQQLADGWAGESNEGDLFDEEEPEYYDQYNSNSIRGEIAEEAQFRDQLRMTINQVLDTSHMSQLEDEEFPLSGEDDFRMTIQEQLEAMPIQFEGIDNDCQFLEEEQEIEFAPELPPMPVNIHELYDEIPSDDFALEAIRNYLYGKCRAAYLRGSDNYYKRHLYMVIENRHQALERIGCQTNRRMTNEEHEQRLGQLVLEELQELRFEQMQNQRVAAGLQRLPEFGPDNWTEDDCFGPQNLDRQAHVFNDSLYQGMNLSGRQQKMPENACQMVEAQPAPAARPKKSTKTTKRTTMQVLRGAPRNAPSAATGGRSQGMARPSTRAQNDTTGRISAARQDAAEARNRSTGRATGCATGGAGTRPAACGITRQTAGGPVGRPTAAGAIPRNTAGGPNRTVQPTGGAAGPRYSGLARPKAGTRMNASSRPANATGQQVRQDAPRPVTRPQTQQQATTTQMAACPRPTTATAVPRPMAVQRPAAQAAQAQPSNRIARPSTGGRQNMTLQTPRPAAKAGSNEPKPIRGGGGLRPPTGPVVRAVAGDGGPDEDRNVQRPVSPRISNIGRPTTCAAPRSPAPVAPARQGPVVRAVAGDGGPDEDRNVQRPVSPAVCRASGLRAPQARTSVSPAGQSCQRRSLQAPKVHRQQPATTMVPTELVGMYGAMNAVQQNASRMQAGRQEQSRFGFAGANNSGNRSAGQ